MADSYSLSVLTDELYALIKEKKELSFDELKKWMKKKEIGYLSLYAVVEELSKKADVCFSEEKVAVELSPIFTFNFPQKIFLKIKKEEKKIEKKEEKKEKVEEVIPLRYTPVKTTKTSKKKMEKSKRHKTLTRVKPLIELIPQPRPEEKVEKVEEKEEKVEEKKIEKEIKEKPKEVSKEEIIEERKEEKELTKEEEEKILEQFDEDMRKAIVYLNNYWSVGAIRFMQDLKRMGVKDPRRLMLKLAELGFVEIVPDGVVNATPKLPKVGKKITLIDLLGLS